MVKIKISGMPDVNLSPHEFNELATALRKMVDWNEGGMYGDGDTITEKARYKRAINVLKKINY